MNQHLVNYKLPIKEARTATPRAAVRLILMDEAAPVTVTGLHLSVEQQVIVVV